MNRKALFIVLIVLACGLSFALGRHRPAATDHASRQVLYYVDPMHPAYHSARAGTAPDCGMDLVPVYAEDAAKAALPAASDRPGSIHIDPVNQRLYGIRLTRAENSASNAPLRVFGKVTADESRIFRVNLGTDGFVKETHDDSVGNHVKKNQHLAIIYSPEFLTVAGGFLSANERTPSAGAKDNGTAALQNAASAQARADRLRALGMSDVQIDEISTTRKLPEDIYVVAPSDGFILSRNISSGLRFERHTDLYTVADLSHVWIIAEVFGADVNAFRPGTPVRVTLPDSGESLAARVSSQLPETDPVSHTLKVRIEADNPSFKLRPDMFVDVEVQRKLPPGLSVPADAVVNSGARRQVFVQTAEGFFEPRTVTTGWRSDDRIQIVAGLHDGETVVSEGTFLVDSESRLQHAAESGKHGAALPSNQVALSNFRTESRP